MSDYISREAAIETVTNYCIKHDLRDLLADIEVIPAADVVEVVRCKDCKHQVKEWREDKRFKDDGYWVYGCEVISDACGYWALFGQDNEFCSEAERREDG